MELKKIIKTTIREYFDENNDQRNELKNILNKLGIYDFEKLGTGQHGIAILNKKNNKFLANIFPEGNGLRINSVLPCFSKNGSEPRRIYKLRRNLQSKYIRRKSIINIKQYI
jgi:hypothetical protein